MTVVAKTRSLAGKQVMPVGLGCMNLSHAYGLPPSREKALNVLERALDLGIEHFDTAALYGFGKNEELVGSFVKAHRNKVLLTSKCGMQGVDGVRVIDGRPETLVASLENSLKRLGTDVIDLFYLHRWDKNVPIEESVGAMSRMVEQGKIKAIGLSEVGAEALRRAHAVHPIAAVQSEYSLWSRNVEIALLDACRDLGCAFVAFSPLARGFLTDADLVPEDFAEKDIRRGMPRFKEPHFSANMKFMPEFRALAKEAGCSAVQLALAWVLQKGDHIHAIPGTTSIEHLEENVAAGALNISGPILDKVNQLINASTVSGPRYPAGTQKEVDTEEF